MLFGLVQSDVRIMEEPKCLRIEYSFGWDHADMKSARENIL